MRTFLSHNVAVANQYDNAQENTLEIRRLHINVRDSDDDDDVSLTPVNETNNYS